LKVCADVCIGGVAAANDTFHAAATLARTSTRLAAAVNVSGSTVNVVVELIQLTFVVDFWPSRRDGRNAGP
jgi:hypothetical protein